MNTHAASPYLEPAVKPSQMLRVYRLLPLVLSLLVALAACAPFPPPPPPRPTATLVDCATTFQCRVVVPHCGPALTPYESNGQGYWYAREGDAVVPRNAASLMGFQLWLPTWILDDTSWYRAVLVQEGAGGKPTQPPLFHVAYGLWPPRINNRLALLPEFALDETTGHLSPLSYLIGENQVVSIQSQRTVTVAGQPMTVYHLVYPPSSIFHDTLLGIEVLWQAGPLTLRVLGVLGTPQDGLTEFAPNPRQGDLDKLMAWATVAAEEGGYDDGVLLHMAASVVPYTGCGE